MQKMLTLLSAHEALSFLFPVELKEQRFLNPNRATNHEIMTPYTVHCIFHVIKAPEPKESIQCVPGVESLSSVISKVSFSYLPPKSTAALLSVL